MDKKIIMDTFYQAFKNGDFLTMNSLYDPSVVFNDSIFTNLNYLQTTAMWKMLLTNKENSKFTLEYQLVEEKNDFHIIWIAKYLFGPKKRKVTNVVKTTMDVVDGKIVAQFDNFNFKKWAKQAIGGPAKLFANRKFFKAKVRTSALKQLINYINTITND